MKKVIIIFIIIFIGSLFLSCKAKKTIETHSTDTIYKSEIIKITPAQLNSLIIESPCDSLGQLKPFNYTFVSDNVKGTVKSYLNAIKIDVNTDSIVNSRIENYKSSLKTENKTIVKEVKRPLNWYLLAYSVLSSLWILRKPLIKMIL